MNLVDSSCWLEYFAGTAAGNKVAAAIEQISNLIVPTIILYEVFKKLLQETDEDDALFAAAHMKQGRVIDLDTDLAIFAAGLSKAYKLSLADSIIYAAARKYKCILWTQDKHFKSLENVRYLPKGRA